MSSVETEFGRSERRRMEENVNVLASLHEHLIVEILLRLPVKSLLQFKCVCKSWRSLICSSQFAKSHFDLAAAPSDRVLISKRRDDVIDSNDLSDESVVFLRLPVHPPTSYRTVLFWGSCRGFVLLQYSTSIGASYTNDLIVWNPSTGEHKLVPQAGGMRYIYMYGFGYDALTDDYLVICINYQRDYKIGADYKNKTDFVLFSVKTNSWNYLQDPYEGEKLYSFEPGLLLNGALHWSASSTEGVEVIVAFDLGQRTLSEIPLPPPARSDLADFDLHIIGGCLSVLGWFGQSSEVWVMKEYKVLSSWTRLFSSPLCIKESQLTKFELDLFPRRPEEISDKTFESNFCCLSILNRHGSYRTRRSVKINQLCEHLTCGGGLVLFGKYLWPALYRESLLSLPGKQESITHIFRQGKLWYSLPYYSK